MNLNGWMFGSGTLALFVLGVALNARAEKPSASPLAGHWTLVAADVTHPDGSRGRDYGEAPKGSLQVDAKGRYSLQIYKSERLKFAANEKAKGTPEEFKSAVMGASCHFGTLELGAKAGEKPTLTFHIESATYPNWEGTPKPCTYELKGDTLSYFSPARPNGDVPISVWKRED